MASLTHSTFHSSYPANTYFKGQEDQEMQATALLRISEEHVDLALVITDFLNFVTISLLITKWWQLSFPMRHLIYLVLIFPQHHPRLFLNTPPPALSQSHDFEAMSDCFLKKNVEVHISVRHQAKTQQGQSSPSSTAFK